MFMITITGYKEVDYSSFQTALHKAFIDSGKKEILIAAEIDVKTPATVNNAFDTENQIVSDKVLTGVMQSIRLNGFVVWQNKERKYFISKR